MGCENSRTMKKLKKHCLCLGKKLCSIMPVDTDLPEGYKIIIKPNTTNDPDYIKKPVLINYQKHISISEPVTREMVIYFTKDIADGLMGKFEQFLNEYQKPLP